MLKDFTLLSIIVLLCWGLKAQCPEGSVILLNQTELDAFVAAYPNCIAIAENLEITSNDITDLSGLSNLTSIGGQLRIENNDALTNLTGLNNLNAVGGDLVIALNATLTNLTGLNNLNTIGGRLEIAANQQALTSLTGLNNLTTIGGNLTITLNDALTNLTGLNNLYTIGGGLYIASNAALTNLAGLSNLSAINGYLEIVANAALTNLTGLNNLNAIGGYLGIFTNAALTDLTGLSSLNAIGEYLSIRSNGALTDLTGLQNIDPSSISGPGLIIDNNPLLSNCAIENICAYLDIDTNTANITGNATGCAIREEVEAACMQEEEGDFIFTSQAELDDFLAGHPNFTQLSGSLSIGNGQSDSDISDLSGLSNLTSISGDLYIFFNSDLHSLQGLNNLTQIGGGLFIFRNAGLVNLNGLERLTNIEGDFYSFLNSSLTAFTGLDMLNNVGGFMAVRNNDALTDFSGLESLINIGDFLAIRDNDALTSLAGIVNLDGSAIDRLYITNNPLLLNCAIESVCTYLNIENKTAQIANNASECNTSAQISNACEASVGMESLELPGGTQVESSSLSSVPLAQHLQIYPNPTSGLLQIRQANELQSVIVLSPQGQQLARFNAPGAELDLGTLPAGVYYLSFLTASERVTRRVVKTE